MSKRRVVVTGMGMVSPLGLNKEETWQNILKGQSGVERIEDFDTSDFSTKIWAKVKGFNIEKIVPFKDAKKMGKKTPNRTKSWEGVRLDREIEMLAYKFSSAFICSIYF